MAGTCWSCAPSTAPSIPGIVHGSSGSGASLFLEPLSTVEINNEIVALEQQEAEEVHRILLALTDALRRRGDDVERTVGAATEFDVLQARASFSTLVNGDASGHRDRRQARVASGATSAADSGVAASPWCGVRQQGAVFGPRQGGPAGLRRGSCDVTP